MDNKRFILATFIVGSIRGGVPSFNQWGTYSTIEEAYQKIKDSNLGDNTQYIIFDMENDSVLETKRPCDLRK